MKNKQSVKNVALSLCVTAMFAALIVGGKMAFAVIPNVEVVTILVAVCAYVWGLQVVLPAVFAFIAVDVAIWGVNTWVFSYIVHWNAVAVVFWLFSFNRFKNKGAVVGVATAIAVVLSACFGVLTTLVDTAIGYTSGGFYFDWANFAYRYSFMYVTGVPFFITHVLCNGILFATAFLPLAVLNHKVRTRMFPPVSVDKNDSTDYTNVQQ